MKNDELIKHMVNRFLAWKLPQNFYPDSFIFFDREKHDTWGGYPNSWPTGTNLFTAEQAKEMLEYLMDGYEPAAKPARELTEVLNAPGCERIKDFYSVGPVQRAAVESFAAALLSADAQRPIDIVLYCPKCGMQHIDAPDDRTPDWSNPPHKSHLCHGCGHIWRPSDTPTNGVERTASGKDADTAPAQRSALKPLTEWQPIETAPKDGRDILLGTYDGSTVVGAWIEDAREFRSDGDFECKWATHWLPLPFPPADRAVEAAHGIKEQA